MLEEVPLLIHHDPLEQEHQSDSVTQAVVAEETTEERPSRYFGKRLRRERRRRWLQAQHDSITICLVIVFLVAVMVISFARSLRSGQDLTHMTVADQFRASQLTRDRKP